MRILFVWRKMDMVAGGVERMITTMMNEMVARGHDVSLLSWDSKDARSFYPLDPSITWHKLDTGSPEQKASLKLRLQRMPRVRKAVKEIKPDLIMCFASGIFLSMRVFLAGFTIPMIAAERNAPSRFQFLSGRRKEIGSLWLADSVTVQFERYKLDYPQGLREKITAIPNPVKQRTSFAAPEGQDKHPKVLLCVARLSYQKNLQALLQAFSNLSPDFPDWRLEIAGDGEDQAKIEVCLSGLDHADQIKFLGRISDTEALYLNAHLFCLPSRWEGFPNALAEALSHGLPAVGYKDCAGTADLIVDGECGVLAAGNGDVTSLEAALRSLMADDALRARMGQAAVQHMKQYSPEHVFDLWEAHFKALVKH